MGAQVLAPAAGDREFTHTGLQDWAVATGRDLEAADEYR